MEGGEGVRGGGGGGVIVRGEFLSGSRAVGCLVVFQGPPTSPDIFRVLQRTQSHQDSVSTTVHLPPSTYTVYGYDVEENGLPNTMPAVVLENQIVNNQRTSLQTIPFADYACAFLVQILQTQLNLPCI